MVNIIDCVRNVASDRYAMIKILILSIPAVIATYATLSGQQIVSGIINIVFGVIFAAIFFETIRRSCNAEPMLLPSFLMPIRMFLTLGLAIIASIPSVIVCFGLFLLFSYILTLYPQLASEQEQVSLYIIAFIFYTLMMSIYFAGVTQSLDTGKVLDSYNPMKVLRALKTFIVNLLFFVIQDFLVVAVFIVLPAMIIFFLSGKNPTNFFMILYLCMGFVFNYLVFADYIGQTKKDSESPYERLF